MTFKIVNYEYTVVGDYINAMKTTFGFNCDLYQAFKQHGYKKWKLKKLLFNYL